MSKTNRFRYRQNGRSKYLAPIVKRMPNVSNEIAVGDFIAVSTKGSGPLSMVAGTAYPFSNFANSAIASIADYFLGIAIDESLNDEEDSILVDTVGEFELSVSLSEKPSVGMFVKAKQGMNSIEAQEITISKTDTANNLGRVSRASSNYERDIRVQIKSAIAGKTN